jgi:hypothetical protein
MIRFVPDDWLEGLLRPLLMMDPVAGVYFESHAPDLRFFAILALLMAAVAARRTWPPLTVQQQLAGLGLFAGLYLWTFVVGNGRYFVWGLLLVGPLSVAAAWLLPAARWRWLALLVLMGLQGLALRESVTADTWGLARWQGREAAIEPSPVRQTPAVFLTISTISYSILVPRFHPESRWANIAGQHMITPDRPEYRHLQDLLASPLPMHVLAPTAPKLAAGETQPGAELRQLMAASLAPHALALTTAPCQLVRSRLNPGPPGPDAETVPQRGFWVCPVERAPGIHAQAVQNDMAQRQADVFSQVEQRCPRFFPPGTGRYANVDTVATRAYGGADTRLYVEESGRVLYKHARALNPTVIGSVDEVRAGRFTLDCHKIDGRYQYPWNRD